MLMSRRWTELPRRHGALDPREDGGDPAVLRHKVTHLLHLLPGVHSGVVCCSAADTKADDSHLGLIFMMMVIHRERSSAVSGAGVLVPSGSGAEHHLADIGRIILVVSRAGVVGDDGDVDLLQDVRILRHHSGGVRPAESAPASDSRQPADVVLGGVCGQADGPDVAVQRPADGHSQLQQAEVGRPSRLVVVRMVHNVDDVSPVVLCLCLTVPLMVSEYHLETLRVVPVCLPISLRGWFSVFSCRVTS